MNKPVAFIIEDDRDVVALFRHVLDIAGYRTEIVLDGNEAMDRLEEFQPNIVLLDLVADATFARTSKECRSDF